MGTSVKCFIRCGVCGDHPHAYGDKLYTVSVPISVARIIPTRMGTSYQLCNCLWRQADHPHAYGDKVFTSPLCVSLRGSSPRVWGQERLNELFKGDEKDHPHAYGDK